jgi:hypothetical protein
MIEGRSRDFLCRGGGTPTEHFVSQPLFSSLKLLNFALRGTLAVTNCQL